MNLPQVNTSMTKRACCEGGGAVREEGRKWQWEAGGGGAEGVAVRKGRGQ